MIVASSLHPLQPSDSRPVIGVFFLAFLSAAVAGLGGRQTVRVARLSAGLGGSGLVLLAALAACGFACIAAAWLGAQLAMNFGPQGRAAFVAAALLSAALDLAFGRAGRVPAEPTRSFGAILLVLAVAQLPSAASLATLAVSTGAGEPWIAGCGGLLGTGGVIMLAWRLGSMFEARLPLAKARWAAAGAFGFTAIGIALQGAGLIR